jgi:hypothetical protein
MRQQSSNPRSGHSQAVLVGVAGLALGFLIPLVSDWAGARTETDLVGLESYVILDTGQDPLETAPGFTAEVFCPAGVNEDEAGELDITSTYLDIGVLAVPSGDDDDDDDDVVDVISLVSFYNRESTSDATQQYWFLDTDLNPETGGSDAVPIMNPGDCPELLPITMQAGFEIYAHSYGPGADEFHVYYWAAETGMWREITDLPAFTVGFQGSDDNPANPYEGLNGKRGVENLPLELLGSTGECFGLLARSWNSRLCCGDDNGASGLLGRDCPVPWDCPATMCGDCDLNGSICILDALCAAQCGVGLLHLDETAYSNCNVFGEMQPDELATVDILDALCIARCSLGVDALHCCME